LYLTMLFLLYMTQSHFKDFTDMLVVERIKRRFSFAPHSHELCRAQQPELVGNCRLAHPHDLSDVADAEFIFKQRTDDPDAGGVAKYLKKFCEGKQGIQVGHVAERLFDMVLMDDGFLTFVEELVGICCHNRVTLFLF
jgi:hypothetical protein